MNVTIYIFKYGKKLCTPPGIKLVSKVFEPPFDISFVGFGPHLVKKENRQKVTPYAITVPPPRQSNRHTQALHEKAAVKFCKYECFIQKRQTQKKFYKKSSLKICYFR